MKILFISERLLWENTGAEIVTKNNLHFLIDIAGEENVDIITFYEEEESVKRLSKYKNVTALKKYDNKILKFINWIKLNNGGINSENNGQVLDIINNNNYEYIFLDSSVYGKLAKYIKINKPKTKIVTFFHDVSKFWSKSLIKTSKEIKGTIRLCTYHPSYVYNESKTIQYTDHIISLNQRDAKLIESEYRKNVNEIIPVNIKDKFLEERINNNPKNETIEILFVGAYYLPNIVGIKWFIDNVMNNINAKLIIVGKGMDALKEEINVDNVEVHGFVEDLDSYYYNSDLVIAPIFDGGGMKVKIAEALMYGKTIVGTTEAFEGYDLDIEKVGYKCDDKNSFIESIEDFIKNKNLNKYNEFSRNEFLEKYEYENCLKKMKFIFN